MKTNKMMSFVLALVLATAAIAGCASKPEPEAHPANLSVHSKAITMNAGDTTTLDYVVDPGDTLVAFKGYDNNIVVVDASGKVVALAEGETIITLDANGVTGVVPKRTWPRVRRSMHNRRK